MNIRPTKTRLAVAIATVVALVPATAVATHVFNDVSDSRFFAEAVEWAADNGITTGTSPTTFDPDRGVTRGESVTFLNRYDTNVVLPRMATLDVVTTTDFDITASTTFVPIPATTIDVLVPSGGAVALITFSGESTCEQDPLAAVFCFVQAVADPGGTEIAAPGSVVFDSVQHGPNSTDILGLGTHSFQWFVELSPGTHTIEMQWMVDEPDAVFTLGPRTLSVQVYPFLPA